MTIRRDSTMDQRRSNLATAVTRITRADTIVALALFVTCIPMAVRLAVPTRVDTIQFSMAPLAMPSRSTKDDTECCMVPIDSRALGAAEIAPHQYPLTQITP